MVRFYFIGHGYVSVSERKYKNKKKQPIYICSKSRFHDRCHAIGFSGHHNGIAVDMCAYTLGADNFERHFTLDRTMKGGDHAASLEEPGLTKLIRDISVKENFGKQEKEKKKNTSDTAGEYIDYEEID